MLQRQIHCTRKMMFLICCAFVLGLESIIAKPFNDSDIALESVNERCTCAEDIKQLYTELRATQQRVLAIENKTPMDRIASDLPSDINLKSIYSEVVGFTVELKNDVIDLPIGSTVLYDGIRYNAGSAYDSSTGVFTCPRSGMYLFAIFVEAVNASPPAAISIVINGAHRLDAVSERYAAGHDSTGGNILIEHIQTGDRVWVHTYAHDNQDLFRAFTTFSGVLIQST